MTLFKLILRVLASAGAVGATALVTQLIALFSGTAPSDISATVWAVVSMVVVFLLNLVLGQIPKPPAAR